LRRFIQAEAIHPVAVTLRAVAILRARDKANPFRVREFRASGAKAAVKRALRRKTQFPP